MDKIIELLGKLLGLLGKIIEGIFSSKTFWLIVVAVAILSLAAVFIYQSADRQELFPFGIEVWRAIAVASIALVLARVIIWVVGLLLKQFA
jgi:magnesium-transporting ATPase (P-type)